MIRICFAPGGKQVWLAFVLISLASCSSYGSYVQGWCDWWCKDTSSLIVKAPRFTQLRHSTRLHTLKTCILNQKFCLKAIYCIGWFWWFYRHLLNFQAPKDGKDAKPMGPAQLWKWASIVVQLSPFFGHAEDDDMLFHGAIICPASLMVGSKNPIREKSRCAMDLQVSKWYCWHTKSCTSSNGEYSTNHPGVLTIQSVLVFSPDSNRTRLWEWIYCFPLPKNRGVVHRGPRRFTGSRGFIKLCRTPSSRDVMVYLDATYKL